MGFRGHGAGHGDMGFRGHGSTGSHTQTNNTPVRLDMGTWGLGDMGGDMGTWGLGDMVLLDHMPKQTTHL